MGEAMQAADWRYKKGKESVVVHEKRVVGIVLCLLLSFSNKNELALSPEKTLFKVTLPLLPAI